MLHFREPSFFVLFLVDEKKARGTLLVELPLTLHLILGHSRPIKKRDFIIARRKDGSEFLLVIGHSEIIIHPIVGSSQAAGWKLFIQKTKLNQQEN